MFFGAGNTILPPIIGLITGGDWQFAVTGFSITAILAPFLGIVAVLISGDSFTDLGKRINSLLGWILATAIILSIGPLVAIPRTAATTFEIGVLPLWSEASPVLSSVVFFGVTLVLSISPSKVVDIIGKYLTPLLLLLLTYLIVKGIMNPLSTNELSSGNKEEAFRLGFSEGYQTMDVLASVIYAGIIITAVKAKGYLDLKSKTRVTYMSGAVAIFCLLVIYGGLVYIGATSGYPVTDSLKRTELLLYISNAILGSSGTLALSLCIALACITTAIALVCATGTFFSQLTNGKLSYRVVVITTCLVSGVLAVKGVDNIIDYAAPFLGIIYPITLTLILFMIAFGKSVPRRAPFVGAIITTAIVALMQFAIYMGTSLYDIDYSIYNGKVDYSNFTITEFFKLINKIVINLPLYNYEVPWLIPAIIAFTIVYVVDKIVYKPSRLIVSQ
ncbi:branched-chain amino acid transport system II carrier protein [Myroides injenensis]|uniref:branched-chain amino acid transport system II carrier protein n=1 Tax=Myroides injenensis TaxID=1183151 RepID=UPI000684CF62